MRTKTRLFWLLAATWLAINPLQAAEQQPDQSQAEARGPHGGTLLQRDDVAVELQIFEQGVPPEYRAWVTQDGRPVTGDMDLGVNLTRLGGQVDHFNFAYQGDYWLGDGVVTEPHSFDVEVNLTLDGKDYQWRWESHEGRTTIAPEIAQRAGIVASEAGPGKIGRAHV